MMSKSLNNRHIPENRLLAGLPKPEFQKLLPNLKPFALVFGEAIYKPGALIRHVYFPNSGIISLLAIVEDRSSLEVGMVGREGMVGLPAFLGVRTSRNGTVVQGAGEALRMKTSAFEAACNGGGKLTQVLRRYTHSRLTQISQVAACNRYHPIDARLARWLLMTSDRMGTDEFQLTQEFLSNMLGVRREGVSKAAGALQKRGLISYSRGTLTTLKRAGLEKIACRCYGIINKEAAVVGQ